MTNLQGKTALITGASRGIGRAIAQMYAAQGCNIAFTYIYEDDEANELTEQLQAQGVQVLCIKSDASNFDAAHEAVKQVVDCFGKLDILVCNAGITRDTLLMRMSEQQWDEVISANLKSAFNFCRACTPDMMRQRSGSIINMSSVVGVHGNAGQCNYAA
nr:SDR family NAD(P)-dependent oxidoreductase [Bacteroidales bacterium]